MKLLLCLITLLSVAPLFATEDPNVPAPQYQRAKRIAQENLMRFKQEISEEEDAFWSLPIAEMERQLGIQRPAQPKEPRQ